jgi:class 3 adenylate cyclase
MGSVPDVHYAKTFDGVRIAYQTVGSGPFDLIFANSWCSHCEYSWTNPRVVRFYESLASFCRLVLFDKRGTGLSDPVSGVPTIDDRMDDIRAVMDALGSKRAALFGASEGAATCALFAATFPERTTAMVLFAPFVVGFADDECPWAWRREFWDVLLAGMQDNWGTQEGSGIGFVCPSLAGNEAASEWYARYYRAAASPSSAIAMLELNTRLDIRRALESVRVPTLVIHRRDETWVNVNYGRYTAAKIPGATLVEIDGTDHYPWEQNADAVVGEIEEFLTGARHERTADRVLATVLFTDIVGSTKRASEMGDGTWRTLLDAYDSAVRRQLERFSGVEIKTTGDGFLATFDGPARAVRCALAIRDASSRLGIEVRCGLHTGEVERRGDDIGGIGVHIGQRVSALAEPGEVRVSRTVVDLVAGSGLQFDDQGSHDLKGIPGSWQLFSVRS